MGTPHKLNRFIVNLCGSDRPVILQSNEKLSAVYKLLNLSLTFFFNDNNQETKTKNSIFAEKEMKEKNSNIRIPSLFKDFVLIIDKCVRNKCYTQSWHG